VQTARLRTTLSLLCPALSSLCLGFGYLPFGSWAAAVAIPTFLVWMAARRWKALWTANLGLTAATTAAVYGLTIGAGLIWMLPAVTLGLASWDLTLLDARLANNPPGVPTGPLEKTHYASLGLALGIGLLVVIIGQLIRFQLPFIFMLLLVALAYYSLDRLLRSLTKQ
jgi:hypothetical protein